jgi:dipeptidyl aminopeptidase/acylaminoacyl peptidase
VSVLDRTPRSAVPDDASALIEEARRRTRRRWRQRGLLLALALIAGGALAYALGSGGSPATIAETSSQPFVNLRAFAGHGELAFVSRGRLWVLDGSAGTLRRLRTPRGFTPASPSFSSDGRWLAWLAQSPSYATPSRLWIARADGSHAHEVTRLPVDQLVGWSPTADVVAVVADSLVSYPYGHPGLGPTTVSLVHPDGVVRRLLKLRNVYALAGSVGSAAWSPSGDQLAVSTYDDLPKGGTTVRAYPVGGGSPTTWFTIANRSRLSGACSGSGCATAAIADLAGWWRGWGIAFWAFTGGMSHNNDSTPLYVLSRPGAAPDRIAQTLSDGTTDAVAPGPDDALALVASYADGREYGQGKVIEHCDASTRACSAIPGGSVWRGSFDQPCIAELPCPFPHPAAGAPGSGVSLDPAWSPTAPLLAYVKAPYALTGGNATTAWYVAHELYLWDSRTGATRRVAAIDGASVPTWSSDGRELLYVSGDGLWLAPASGGKPVEIEHPLFPATEWRATPVIGSISYYGQIAWGAQFAWRSPS